MQYLSYSNDSVGPSRRSFSKKMFGQYSIISKPIFNFYIYTKLQCGSWGIFNFSYLHIISVVLMWTGHHI